MSSKAYYANLLYRHRKDSYKDVLQETSPRRVPVQNILPTMPASWTREGVPQFSTAQLSWAYPEEYGWTDYEVIEGPALTALSYQEELLLPKRRPVHRYNRTDRFRNILKQLMMGCGTIPGHILDIIPQLDPKGNLWEDVRKVLKKKHLRRFYNRIPAILCENGYIKLPRCRNPNAYDDIMDDFNELNEVFNKSKLTLKRVYFPNLRYICLKLMERNGVFMPLKIPKARTSKKCLSLDETFDKMWHLINEEEDSIHI